MLAGEKWLTDEQIQGGTQTQHWQTAKQPAAAAAAATTANLFFLWGRISGGAAEDLSGSAHCAWTIAVVWLLLPELPELLLSKLSVVCSCLLIFINSRIQATRDSWACHWAAFGRRVRPAEMANQMTKTKTIAKILEVTLERTTIGNSEQER